MIDTIPILLISNLDLYISGKKILRSLNLEIFDKEITIIMGPSGTGKSTLLRTLAGLNYDNPQIEISGHILFRGKNLLNSLEKPALVQQKLTHLTNTVKENILSHLPNRSNLGLLEQISVIKKITQNYDQAWILDNLNHSTAILERYQSKILAIICTILSNPMILMLDEPTAGLTDDEAILVHDLIIKISKTVPIVIVSHHIQRSKELANRVVLLANGCVQEENNTETFFNDPKNELTKQYLKTGSCAEISAHDLDNLELEQENFDLKNITNLKNNKFNQNKYNFPPINQCTASKISYLNHNLEAKSQSRGPKGFVWLIRGRLAGTPCPGIVGETMLDLGYLKDVGITELISLTEEMFNPLKAKVLGIDVSHFPIIDMSVPSLKDAEWFCQNLDQKITEQKIIAIHCKAGLGRTGTMLAAYYLWKAPTETTAQQAIDYIRSLNHQMIQSQQQINFLYSFSEYIKTYIKTNSSIS